MSSDDRPFITLPADQPDYETLSGLTLEQKAVLPARFHTPDWLDTTPGVFVCRVCWDEGEVTGWPCASALAGRDQVFADPVDAPAREVPAEDRPKPRPPRVFPKGSTEPEDVEAVTDEAGFRWNRAAQANPSQHYWRRTGWGLMGRPTLWTALNRRQSLTEVLDGAA